jgi:rRNA-processing protein FCF1
MRVYFDTSCLCRPLDDRAIPRNAVEREAILAILQMARRGEIALIISQAVLQEIEETPDDARRGKLKAIAATFHDVLPVSEEVLRRGSNLQISGFKGFDALHIAVAESAGVDFLCTADDRLKKRSATQAGIRVRVVTPLELFEEL